jgi:hypothetical protein
MKRRLCVYFSFLSFTKKANFSLVYSIKDCEMEADGEARAESTAKMEETRKNLRRLTVEEEEKEQASNDRVGKVKAAALEAWGKLKEMLGGKKLMVSQKGTFQVKGEHDEVGKGEEPIQLEDITGEAEDGVLILIEDEETMSVES